MQHVKLESSYIETWHKTAKTTPNSVAAGGTKTNRTPVTIKILAEFSTLNVLKAVGFQL